MTNSRISVSGNGSDNKVHKKLNRYNLMRRLGYPHTLTIANIAYTWNVGTTLAQWLTDREGARLYQIDK